MDAIERLKGEDIVLMDIQGMSVLADYFVIASADNERQLKAMAEAVVEAADAKRKTSLPNFDRQVMSGWVLVDLGDVVVHLFSPAVRVYYDLEGLWAQARVLLRVQ